MKMRSTPQPQRLARLGDLLSEDIDLFICSASFESRCLSIAKWLNRDRIRHVLIAKNEKFFEEVGANLHILRSWFPNNSSIVEVDSDNPLSTTENIVGAIQSRREDHPQRVVIDISTFTHEALLILFYVCNSGLGPSSTVEFLYSPASEYSIGDEPAAKWLSRGIVEVRSVMGYPGGFSPSRATHLVVLAGFEDYRTLNLIRELEPSLVSIGFGDSTEIGTEPHQATNEMKVQRLRSFLGNVQDFVFSCYDPSSAEGTIREVISKEGEYNTIVAPMNTKISTLGAGMAALKDESVQICYAQADMYNYTSYSRPGDEFYISRIADYPANK